MTTDTIKPLNPQGMSRAKDILQILPIGKTTLWRMVKNGKFPKPIKIGDNCTVWKNAEVLAWIDAQGGEK